MAMPETTKRSFLIVGLACIDIINVCPRYPGEDEDIRAVDQEYRRGGNSANTSCVLTQLPGVKCSLMATLPSSGWETDFVQKDLQEKHGVDLQYCVKLENCRLPTSFVVLSQATGTRTIVHYRKLDELQSEDFMKLPLSQYSWIHFEGRNAEEIVKMIDHVESYRSSNPSLHLTTSVEVEKRRPELYPLMDKADVVFVSKDVAQELGYTNVTDAISGLRERCRDNATLVCAWGAAGADGYSKETGHVHCDAFPPARLVDTLAAGDTFNAGVMCALEKKASLLQALTLGCWLAGRKCGQMGIDNLLSNLSPADPVYELCHV